MANLAVRCPRTATTGRFRVIGAEQPTAAVLGRRLRPSGRRRPFLHSARVSGPSHTLWRRPSPDPELRPLALFHGRGQSAFKVWSAVLRSSRWWRKRERVHRTSPHGSTAKKNPRASIASPSDVTKANPCTATEGWTDTFPRKRVLQPERLLVPPANIDLLLAPFPGLLDIRPHVDVDGALEPRVGPIGDPVCPRDALDLHLRSALQSE